METQTHNLPGGYLDQNGILHKTVEVIALAGKEEELLTQYEHLSSRLVTELICHCVLSLGDINPVTRDVARRLLVADREFIILMLRQVTFGDRVESTLPCPWPDCGERIDVDFNISNIPLTFSGEIKPFYSCEVEAPAPSSGEQARPVTAIFRLPNGEDQEAVCDFDHSSAASITSMLLHRCLLKIGDNDSVTLEDVHTLGAPARHLIEKTMEERAPNLDLTMELDCPECKRSFIAPFELQDFFFSEVRTNLELLYREIHYLAFHYHWSESEIMDMPRERRRKYISVLADEIEKINDASY